MLNKQKAVIKFPRHRLHGTFVSTESEMLWILSRLIEIRFIQERPHGGEVTIHQKTCPFNSKLPYKTNKCLSSDQTGKKKPFPTD